MTATYNKADASKIAEALIDGASYYEVPYPTGVTIRSEDGCHIIYNHRDRIITSYMRRADAEKVVSRASTAARKRMAA